MRSSSRPISGRAQSDDACRHTPRSSRRRRAPARLFGVVGAVVGLIAAMSGFTIVGAAIGQPAPTDPQLFDLGLARSELSSLIGQADELELAISNALAQIDGMTDQRDFLDLNRPARLEEMQASRTRARQMAIAAYVGIGPPLSGFDLLDAETASDLSWRNALMRQQSERLAVAAETYALLSGEADANVRVLSDDINAETRQLEALNRQLGRILPQIERAEWYVSIAEIHAEADQVIGRTLRAEPTPEQWRKLRFCESTERYETDTGNTFYGAYQFTADTWRTVGGDGNPALAPPAEQDARARLLYADRGAQPWPICGRYLPGG